MSEILAPSPVSNRAAASAARFPSTCWTAVLSLKAGDGSEVREKALRALCHAYWFPLYAFARHRGLQRHDAEDAVQNFFTSIGGAGFFSQADEDKGRLRTFILTAFTRQMRSQTLRDNAQKRGGGVEHVSLDTDAAEAWLLADPKPTGGDATLAFERHWAKNIIRNVMAALREEESSERAAARFAVFSRFLSPDTCVDYTPQQAAADTGMTPAACEKAIQRLRLRFRLAVREEVAATLHNPDESSVMEEMVQLQKSLLARE